MEIMTTLSTGTHDSIKVVDHRKEAYDVYIGRPSRNIRPNRQGLLPKSFKWGNPFVEGKHGTREEVIAKYREWLLSNPELLKQLPELRGKTLGCWCKPRPCHGNVIKEFVEELQLQPQRRQGYMSNTDR